MFIVFHNIVKSVIGRFLHEKKIAFITDGWGRVITYTWIQGYRNYMAAHQSDMDLYIFRAWEFQYG